MAEKKQAQFKTYGYKLMQIKVDSTALPACHAIHEPTVRQHQDQGFPENIIRW